MAKPGTAARPMKRRTMTPVPSLSSMSVRTQGSLYETTAVILPAHDGSPAEDQRRDGGGRGAHFLSLASASLSCSTSM